MTVQINRRNFLWGATTSLILCQANPISASLVPASSGPMEPWRKGMLDIHHISTGRGNSVLAICPDGTSVMIDAGTVGGPTDYVDAVASPTGTTVAVYSGGLVADVLVFFALAALSLSYASKAARGELFTIPLVGALADRLFRRI